MTKSKLKTQRKTENAVVNTLKIIGAIVFLIPWGYAVCYIAGELIGLIF